MVKIKGTAVSDTLQQIKEKRGIDGYNRVVSSLNEESRAILVDQTIFPSSFYSLDAFVDLLQQIVSLYYSGNYTVLTQLSEQLIEEQLRGVYRIFVRLSSPEFVATRVANMNVAYFKGIAGEAQKQEGKSFVSRYYGFQSQHAIFEYCIVGYFQAALKICGVSRVRARFTTPISQGGPFSECTVTWE